MKKGRHRRYEEARALKHTSDDLDILFRESEEPCPECSALPGQDHKSWCEAGALVAEVEDDDDEDLFPT
ncbi:MAG: hypothetical protein KDB21_16175 [Acidimicrobiales bacterium]|nr:hypothetical protein [Acidimicrobiales bacterium]